MLCTIADRGVFGQQNYKLNVLMRQKYIENDTRFRFCSESKIILGCVKTQKNTIGGWEFRKNGISRLVAIRHLRNVCLFYFLYFYSFFFF